MIGMTDVALLDWLGRTLHASEGQSREDSQELYRLIAARLRGEAQAEQAVAAQPPRPSAARTAAPGTAAVCAGR